MEKRHAELTEKILSLKEEKRAVILAHNYQLGEVQDIETISMNLVIVARIEQA